MHRIGNDKHEQAGVTLLELMIVVTLVAILAMIAVPSYRKYTLRAHRTEATSALMKLSANEERYYLQNHQYTLNPSDLGFTGGKSENGTYTLQIMTTGGVASDYTATATPTPGGGTNGVNMQLDTDCTSFSITSTGVRTAGPSTSCW